MRIMQGVIRDERSRYTRLKIPQSRRPWNAGFVINYRVDLLIFNCVSSPFANLIAHISKGLPD